MKSALTAFFLTAIGIGAIGYAQDRQPDEAKLLELYQTQQYGQAAAYLEHFYPDTVMDEQALGRLAYCYRMAGDYPKARHYYLQLFARDSLNVSTLANLAAIHVHRGTYPAAVDYYQRIIAIDTNHVASYDALSGLMRRRGDLDAAYGYLERANRIQPANSNIAYDFAQLCVELEQYNQADSVLQIALQTDPEHGLLLLGRVRVVEKLKLYTDVVTLGEQLLKLGDESQQLLVSLARGYFHTDDFVGCTETYERLLSVYGGGIGELDYYYMATAYKAMKQYKPAMETMDKLLELAISPNVAIYYGRKAELHDLLNQPSAAASNYLRSFRFEVIPIHYYSLAVLYDRKLTDTRNALQYYRLYLKQNPPKEEQAYVDYVQRRITELERGK